MNNIKPIILAALVMMALILSVAALGQTAMAETSAGYSPSLHTTTFIMKVGIMSDDAEVNNAHGIYCKMNYNLTRRADVPQMIGLHYLYNVNGVRINVGADYHLYIPQEKWKFSYGVSKYFNNKPIVISADMSGKYFSASIGFFGTI
jgi:hypothetical protein